MRCWLKAAVLGGRWNKGFVWGGMLEGWKVEVR